MWKGNLLYKGHLKDVLILKKLVHIMERSIWKCSMVTHSTNIYIFMKSCNSNSKQLWLQILSLASASLFFQPTSISLFFKIIPWLEVNKCAFTFSSEIRQIQCTRTEFWCVQCPRPAGPSALDKHQIQASALDLSYFKSKIKCKFINLIHTRQKNNIICSCSWKVLNKKRP